MSRPAYEAVELTKTRPRSYASAPFAPRSRDQTMEPVAWFSAYNVPAVAGPAGVAVTKTMPLAMSAYEGVLIPQCIDHTFSSGPVRPASGIEPSLAAFMRNPVAWSAGATGFAGTAGPTMTSAASIATTTKFLLNARTTTRSPSGGTIAGWPYAGIRAIAYPSQSSQRSMNYTSPGGARVPHARRRSSTVVSHQGLVCASPLLSLDRARRVPSLLAPRAPGLV